MDYLFLFNTICARRGKKLWKVESVAFNVRLDFGLADQTELLPVAANVFYYCDGLTFNTSNGMAGIPNLELGGNSGQGSVGTVIFEMLSKTTTFNFSKIGAFECDYMKFGQGTYSAGTIRITGTVFKITYIN
jgi:hypothetical protein